MRQLEQLVGQPPAAPLSLSPPWTEPTGCPLPQEQFVPVPWGWGLGTRSAQQTHYTGVVSWDFPPGAMEGGGGHYGEMGHLVSPRTFLHKKQEGKSCQELLDPGTIGAGAGGPWEPLLLAMEGTRQDGGDLPGGGGAGGHGQLQNPNPNLSSLLLQKHVDVKPSRGRSLCVPSRVGFGRAGL